VGASVRGTSGFSSDQCATSAGFQFCGGVDHTVLTDGAGTATITGWATNHAPAADVVYSDGVLAQRLSVALPTDDTTVHLQYMPWLTVNADGSPVDVGQLSTLAFTVNDAQGALADRVGRRAATGGVQISVTPPAGWTARRCAQRSVMSGTTDRHGRLALHVCASTSGVYRFVTHGAVTTKSVLLRVRGAAPMSPTSLSARSPRPGVVTASWGRPVYTGGAAISAFRVTASAPHQRSRTATVTARGAWTAQAMTHRFVGLSSARTWTVSVKAITRHGASRPTRVAVRVA
jgi:hypothetical protein